MCWPFVFSVAAFSERPKAYAAQAEPLTFRTLPQKGRNGRFGAACDSLAATRLTKRGGENMSAGVQESCRKMQCANPIPAALVKQHLCLEHFLDEAYLRTDQTSRSCREGKPIQPTELEWLLADALVIVKNLETDAAIERADEMQRDRMLELLLILANLHEYVAHHSVRLDRPA
jgi:hypothetical protein